MKKIFISIPWFLPAAGAGDIVQSVASLVSECNDGLEYFIFCSDIDTHGGALENITTGEWIPFNENTKVWYAGPERISDYLVKQVEAVKPDVLYIVGMYSWHFNMVPLIFCKVKNKILSVRGMLQPDAFAQKKWRKRLYLRLMKLLEYEHKISFHALDAEEEATIHKHFGKVAKVMIAGSFPSPTAEVNHDDALPALKEQYVTLFTT